MDKLKNKYYREKRWFGSHRDEVLTRDGFRCVICGSDKVVVHHKDLKGRRHPDPNNALDNLQTLCASCHGKIHAAKISKVAVIEVMKNWDWSNSRLAVLLGLSHPTITKIRKEIRNILEMTPPKSTAMPEYAVGNEKLLNLEANYG